MLNRRHKAILFLTLVFTGSSLLAGATLNTAFGLLLLGGALAWLVGSRTAKKGYDFSRQIPEGCGDRSESSCVWQWAGLFSLY